MRLWLTFLLQLAGAPRDVLRHGVIGGGAGKVALHHSSVYFPGHYVMVGASPSLSQGEMINRIEHNVETAAVHVDQGKREIRTAVQFQRKNRRVRAKTTVKPVTLS